MNRMIDGKTSLVIIHGFDDGILNIDGHSVIINQRRFWVFV